MGDFRADSATEISSWQLRDKSSLRDLPEVQKRFELPSPALVEKDWYVVAALAAINIADVKKAQLSRRLSQNPEN
jgi:hypothetical protein